MSPAASEAIVALTIAVERLTKAVEECDRLRRPPAKPSSASALGERVCADCESFDLEFILKQVQALKWMATNRAQHVEWISEEIRKGQAVKP